MTTYKKANQGGSIKIYWIVAAILVIGVALTINFVRQKAEQARKEQAIAVVDDKESQSKEESKPTEAAADDQKPVIVQDSSNNGATQQPSVENSSTLPRTGPSDMSQFLMLGLLAGLITAWIRSRAMLKQPL